MLPDEDPIALAEELIAGGRAREAVSILDDLLAAGRGGLLMRLTRARALRAAGDTDAALASAKDLASLHPDVAVVVVVLGEAMLAAGLLPVAIAEFQRTLRLDPANEAARQGLARAWLEAGEPDKALEASDDGAIASEAHAMKAAQRSNARYVRHLFDQFSGDYDSRMIGQLGYRAPQILRELFDLTIAGAGLSVLDFGCGTGLSGLAFRDVADRLDGIDLSPRMIDKARARGVYDSLMTGDIETPPATRYDLILAADTLVYLGDLAAVFAAAAQGLLPDGHFLFTVESKDGEGFELGPKRRWRHSEVYLRGLADTAGFEVAGLVACSPRSEAGRAVPGFAVALRLAEKVG